jgi:streptomycin 6-kinase
VAERRLGDWRESWNLKADKSPARELRIGPWKTERSSKQTATSLLEVEGERGREQRGEEFALWWR